MSIDRELAFVPAVFTSRLSALVEEPSWIYYVVPGAHAGRRYVGRVRPDRFEIHVRQKNYNSFAPRLYGSVEPTNSGCRIRARVGVSRTTTTFASDGLDSVRAEVSDSGGVSRSFRYAAFGGLVMSFGGSPTLLAYAGELSDPTGLVFLRARWYDPSTGRFMTSDPERGDPSSPRSLNPYIYGYANPILLTDPTGRCPMCWGAAFGFVGYWVYVKATRQPFDPAQAVIATAAGAATGGLSAFVGQIGFTGAAAIATRAASGAAIAGIAQIASLDARILAGEKITRTHSAEIPASMIAGGLSGALPLRDPDRGRGIQAFITGVGIGGANAVVGTALQELLARLIADAGGRPARDAGQK